MGVARSGQFASAQGDRTQSSVLWFVLVFSVYMRGRRSETNFSTRLPGFKPQPCFLLAVSLCFSVPQFPHLRNGSDNTILTTSGCDADGGS